MKVFCCLLASQHYKVFPSFMHFSAFKFSLQKWNNIRVCCQKRIEQCQLFCCFCKQASFFLELSHFVLILKQKATKNEFSFFFFLWQLRNQQFFFFSICFLFQAGEMLLQPNHSFAINKKKTTQTFIQQFFFQNNKFCVKFGQSKVDPQMQCWLLGYKFIVVPLQPITWMSASLEPSRTLAWSEVKS